VENGALCVVGLDFFAAERAANEVPLILGCVLARVHVVYDGYERRKWLCGRCRRSTTVMGVMTCDRK